MTVRSDELRLQDPPTVIAIAYVLPSVSATGTYNCNRCIGVAPGDGVTGRPKHSQYIQLDRISSRKNCGRCGNTSVHITRTPLNQRFRSRTSRMSLL